MTEAKPRVVFVHIPRTAGTSLGRLLERIYPAAETANFYADAVTQTANANIERFLRLGRDDKRAHRLIKGHVRYGFDDDLIDYQHITMLRKPLDRLISYYNYVLSEKSHYMRDYIVQRDMTVGDFLLSGMSVELDNFMVRAISGADLRSARDKVDEEHLDLAKTNLRDRFAAFGISERFEASLRVFSHRFGWQHPSTLRVNASHRGKGHRLLRSVERDVLSLNRFDEEFYSYAEALFAERSVGIAAPGVAPIISN